MDNRGTHTSLGTAAKVGALLFLLWSVLHIWVGFEGTPAFKSEIDP